LLTFDRKTKTTYKTKRYCQGIRNRSWWCSRIPWRMRFCHW